MPVPRSSASRPGCRARCGGAGTFSTPFSLAELRDEAASGDLADPDGDGMANLLEFALGANPRVGEAGMAPMLQLSPTTGKMRVVYRRQRDRALSALTYSVERADSPAGPWAPLSGATEVGVTLLGTVETVTAEFAASGNVFVRIRASR